MKAFSWLIGVISALCAVAALTLYAERSSQRSEVAALKDDAEIAWRNYRDLEAEIAKCRKANATLKAVK
jgi:N-methylhydantoinase B/oxoprolinase/acetone carboxylase alpha subunit